jgi:DNA-binding transcriptional MerR regulator
MSVEGKRYTTEEVSVQIGLSASTVRDYSKIFGVGQKAGGCLLFSVKDIAVLKARRKTRGRPKTGETVEPIRRRG